MIPRRGGARGEVGLTLVDVTIGLVILATATFLIFNVFVSGMTQSRASGVQTEAATWTQGEVEYLRGLSYTWGPSYTPPCLVAGTWTITSGSGGCTSQPFQPLPAEFDHASVQIEDNALGQTGLKRITIQVFKPSTNVFYRVVTYVTQFV